MSDADDAGTEALALFAASVRRLIDVTVRLRAPAAALRTKVAELDHLIAELQPFIPDPPPPRYPTSPRDSSPAAIFPYDVVLGALNPLAAPMQIEWHEPKAVGTVTFGTPYEGPPGCVHGAVIAASFDQMLNIANLMMGTPGPTRRLELRYHRPTPLHRPLRFEAWRERVEERKVYARGQLLADDTVTVEAEGVFVMIPLERVMQLLENSDRETK